MLGHDLRPWRVGQAPQDDRRLRRPLRARADRRLDPSVCRVGQAAQHPQGSLSGHRPRHAGGGAAPADRRDARPCRASRRKRCASICSASFPISSPIARPVDILAVLARPEYRPPLLPPVGPSTSYPAPACRRRSPVPTNSERDRGGAGQGGRDRRRHQDLVGPQAVGALPHPGDAHHRRLSAYRRCHLDCCVVPLRGPHALPAAPQQSALAQLFGLPGQ